MPKHSNPQVESLNDDVCPGVEEVSWSEGGEGYINPTWFLGFGDVQAQLFLWRSGSPWWCMKIHYWVYGDMDEERNLKGLARCLSA